jgi:hypothetical protein
MVARTIPAARRDDLLGDMRESYASLFSYIQDIAGTVPFVVDEEIRRKLRTSANDVRTDTAVSRTLLYVLMSELLTRVLEIGRATAAVDGGIPLDSRLLMFLGMAFVFVGLRRLRYTAHWWVWARPFAWSLTIAQTVIVVATFFMAGSTSLVLDRGTEWIVFSGLILFCVQRKVLLSERQ